MDRLRRDIATMLLSPREPVYRPVAEQFVFELHSNEQKKQQQH